MLRTHLIPLFIYEDLNGRVKTGQGRRLAGPESGNYESWVGKFPYNKPFHSNPTLFTSLGFNYAGIIDFAFKSTVKTLIINADTMQLQSRQIRQAQVVSCMCPIFSVSLSITVGNGIITMAMNFTACLYLSYYFISLPYASRGR